MAQTPTSSALRLPAAPLNASLSEGFYFSVCDGQIAASLRKISV